MVISMGTPLCDSWRSQQQAPAIASCRQLVKNTRRSPLALSNTNLQAGSPGVLPTSTKTLLGNEFRHGDFDLPDATPDAKVLTNVEPVPQAELKPLEPQNQMAVLPSRRRFRAHSTRPLDDELAIGAEQASSSDSMLLTASSCKQRRFSLSLPKF